MKPNFLVIGSARSGTTTLCHLLDQHPESFMSSPKEPEFFCKDHIYAKGWDWYESLFANAIGKNAIGEGSTSYTKAPLFAGVPPRIAKHLPDARLIYIVRHPLKRIESHWRLRVVHYDDHRSFKKMLQKNRLLIDTSRYWYQISQYREYFPDKQILVLFFEDLESFPEEVMMKCFEFLGIDSTLKLVNPTVRCNVTPLSKDGTILQYKKPIPQFKSVNRLFSRLLMKRVKPMTEIQVRGNPEWNEKMRYWVVSEIADDIQKFLEFYGKHRNFWNLKL